MQIAESISPRLAQEVLAVEVNGTVQDLLRPINEDSKIRLLKWEDDEGKHAFWHTSSHLLAEALEALYPGIKFGIGPAIETGSTTTSTRRCPSPRATFRASKPRWSNWPAPKNLSYAPKSARLTL